MPGLLSALVALENQYGAPAPTSAAPTPTAGAPPTPMALPAANAPVADWTQYYQTNPSLETAATNQAAWTAELQNQNWLQTPQANQRLGYDTAVGLPAPTAADYTSYDNYEQHVAAVNAQNAAGQAAYQQQLAAYNAQQVANQAAGGGAVTYDPTTGLASNFTGTQPVGTSSAPNPYVNIGYGSVPEAVAVPAVGAYGPTAGSEFNLSPTQVGGGVATAKGSSGNTLFGSGPVTAIAAGLPLDQSQLLAQADQLRAYIAAVESNGTGWHAGPNGMPVPNGQGGYDPGIFGGSGGGLISDAGTGIWGEFAGGTPSGGPVGAIDRAHAAPGASFGQGGGGGFGGPAAGSGINPGANVDVMTGAVTPEGAFGGPPPEEAPAAASADTGQGFATDALPSTPSFAGWLASLFPGNGGDAVAQGQATFGGGPPAGSSPQETFGGGPPSAPPNASTPDASGAPSGWGQSPSAAQSIGQNTFGGGLPSEAPPSLLEAFGGSPASQPGVPLAPETAQAPGAAPGTTDITQGALSPPSTPVDTQTPVPSGVQAPWFGTELINAATQGQDVTPGAGFADTTPAGPATSPAQAAADELQDKLQDSPAGEFIDKLGSKASLLEVVKAFGKSSDVQDLLSNESYLGHAAIYDPYDLTQPLEQQVKDAIGGSGLVASQAWPKMEAALTGKGITQEAIQAAAKDYASPASSGNQDIPATPPPSTFDQLQQQQNSGNFWGAVPAMTSGVPNQDITGQPIYNDESPRFPDNPLASPSVNPQPPGIAAFIPPGEDLAGQPNPDVTYGQFNTNTQFRDQPGFGTGATPAAVQAAPAQQAQATPSSGITPEDIAQDYAQDTEDTYGVRIADGKSPESMRLDLISPKLLDTMGGAAQAFEEANPGYTVEVFSGHRFGATQAQHASDTGALDMQIVDPDGNVIPSEGKDTTGLYTELAGYARGTQQAVYPDLGNQLNWGGYFSASGQRGVADPQTGALNPDLMHFDLGGQAYPGRAGITTAFGAVAPQVQDPNQETAYIPNAATSSAVMSTPQFGALQGQQPQLPATPAQEAVATSAGGVPGNINAQSEAPGSGGGGPQAGAPYTYGFMTGGAGIPAAMDTPAVQYALNQLAQSTGYSPQALAAVIQEESAWNPQSTTGAYSGLFQQGAGSGVPNGVALLSESPEQQISQYQDWMNFYKLPSRIKNAGIDLSSMSPEQQAAMIQGLQFAPNSNAWLSNIAAGNNSVPATTSKQAGNLGNTSFQAMLSMFAPYMAAHPPSFRP